MRESQNLFWGDITKKQVAFTIIWTIGIICWGYFILQFTERLHEADWAYSEAMKIRQERIENNIPAGEVEVKTSPDEKPEAVEGEDKISSLPPARESVEEKVLNKFGEDGKIALAVFKSESGLKLDAQGWNCYYGNESKACRPEDKGKAWSVDCGIGQLNFPGKVCPPEAFDPDWNIQQAFKKYEARHFQPWTNYRNNRYLAFL